MAVVPSLMTDPPIAHLQHCLHVKAAGQVHNHPRLCRGGAMAHGLDLQQAADNNSKMLVSWIALIRQLQCMHVLGWGTRPAPAHMSLNPLNPTTHLHIHALTESTRHFLSVCWKGQVGHNHTGPKPCLPNKTAPLGPLNPTAHLHIHALAESICHLLTIPLKQQVAHNHTRWPGGWCAPRSMLLLGCPELVLNPAQLTTSHPACPSRPSTPEK
jgi:hypothetical protein